MSDALNDERRCAGEACRQQGLLRRADRFYEDHSYKGRLIRELATEWSVEDAVEALMLTQRRYHRMIAKVREVME